MLTITEKAAKKALQLASKEGRPAILRVGIRGGGCSGLSYFYEFCDATKPNDWQLETCGLLLVCDPKSLQYLQETEIDYDSNILKGGFRFNNPQAKRSCSCGESFTIA